MFSSEEEWQMVNAAIHMELLMAHSTMAIEALPPEGETLRKLAGRITTAVMLCDQELAQMDDISSNPRIHVTQMTIDSTSNDGVGRQHQQSFNY